MKTLITLLLVLSAFKSVAHADCPVAVQIQDGQAGIWETEILNTIRDDLAPKGYNVFLSTGSQTADLVFTVSSQSFYNEAAALYLPQKYEFSANLSSQSLHADVAGASDTRSTVMPLVFPVTMKSQKNALLQVTQDTLDQVQNCTK
jgi:hypothetical protein